VYALKLKQFVFSNEVIETGIPQIDGQIRECYPRTKLIFNSINGSFKNDEVVYQGNSLANATAQAIVYDFIPNTHITVYRKQGVFKTGLLKVSSSNTEATIMVVNDTVEMNNAFEDIIDNNRIQEEGLSVIDWTEKNPFGET